MSLRKITIWTSIALLAVFQGWGAGLEISKGSVLLPAKLGAPKQVSYYHANHLQSVQIITNQSGEAVQQFVYRPFGEEKSVLATTLNFPSNLFTDQILDAETGLYFFRSRYYDPTLGRFLKPDTIVPDPGNPQALNRFSYVFNNPLRFNDPSGHAPDGPSLGQQVLSAFRSLIPDWLFGRPSSGRHSGGSSWEGPSMSEVMDAKRNFSRAATTLAAGGAMAMVEPHATAAINTMDGFVAGGNFSFGARPMLVAFEQSTGTMLALATAEEFQVLYDAAQATGATISAIELADGVSGALGATLKRLPWVANRTSTYLNHGLISLNGPYIEHFTVPKGSAVTLLGEIGDKFDLSVLSKQIELDSQLPLIMKRGARTYLPGARCPELRLDPLNGWQQTRFKPWLDAGVLTTESGSLSNLVQPQGGVYRMVTCLEMPIFY